MRSILVLALCTVGLQAQSMSVTSPVANQVVSGFSGFFFAVNLTGAASSVARVCYAVDGYPATNPGYGGLATAGCTLTPGFTQPWSTFWVMNGPHQVLATGYDALGNVVATATQLFTVANTW